MPLLYETGDSAHGTESEVREQGPYRRFATRRTGSTAVLVGLLGRVSVVNEDRLPRRTGGHRTPGATRSRTAGSNWTSSLAKSRANA